MLLGLKLVQQVGHSLYRAPVFLARLRHLLQVRSLKKKGEKQTEREQTWTAGRPRPRGGVTFIPAAVYSHDYYYRFRLFLLRETQPKLDTQVLRRRIEAAVRSAEFSRHSAPPRASRYMRVHAYDFEVIF